MFVLSVGKSIGSKRTVMTAMVLRSSIVVRYVLGCDSVAEAKRLKTNKTDDFAKREFSRSDRLLDNRNLHYPTLTMSELYANYVCVIL